jgi:predicted ATPase
MATLNVSEFSCLKEAEFDLAAVNVIIGPQGSGKSVTTKLFYFFADVQQGCIDAAERGDSLEDYQRQLAKQFALWFPPTAWGKARFNLSFQSGAFGLRVLRRKKRGKLAEDVSVTFSEGLDEFYNRALRLFDDARSKATVEADIETSVRRDIDRTYRVREGLLRRFPSELRTEFFRQQTFIPAGRAYFTSIGRLVAGMEQAGSLDPVTIAFAKLFANLRDRSPNSGFYRWRRLSADSRQRRESFMKKLLGGEVKFERDTEYLETPDGRKVPFSSLSSGQQELIPMWSLVDYYSELDAFRAQSKVARRYREILYIEEPEAHLFPSAQSTLMEFLIGSIVSNDSSRHLVLTTHSPYIMSKLNVFLKAGQLAR